MIQLVGVPENEPYNNKPVLLLKFLVLLVCLINVLQWVWIKFLMTKGPGFDLDHFRHFLMEMIET